MTGPSELRPEEWILDQLREAEGPLPPGELLMPEERPEEFDSVSLQFAFWRLLSSGQIKLNRNRSVSLSDQDAEHRRKELAPS